MQLQVAELVQVVLHAGVCLPVELELALLTAWHMASGTSPGLWHLLLPCGSLLACAGAVAG